MKIRRIFKAINRSKGEILFAWTNYPKDHMDIRDITKKDGKYWVEKAHPLFYIMPNRRYLTDLFKSKQLLKLIV